MLGCSQWLLIGALQVRDDASKCLTQLAIAERAHIHELRVAEPVIEGIEIYPVGLFVGGQEGKSIFSWCSQPSRVCCAL